MDAEGQNDANQNEIGRSDIENQVKARANNTTATGKLVVFLIVYIITLFIGIVKVNKCPIKKLVPIYLIVAGIIGILSKVLPFINSKLEMKLITFFISFINICEIFWMGATSYGVYSIYTPNFDESQLLYCSKTAYYLAFCLLTVNWIFLILSILPC